MPRIKVELNNTYCFKTDRLRALLQAQRLTPALFAKKLGVTRQLVFSWLRGDATPGIQPLMKMCELFGLEIGWFFPQKWKGKMV